MNKYPEVFQYDSSNNYLKAMVEYMGRGSQKKMAEAMNCQAGYLTRILQNSAELSLEQAEAITNYFNLTKEEKRFFLLLVQKERAGTSTLRKFLENEEDTLRKDFLNLGLKYTVKEEIPEEILQTYFSDWQKIVIHLAINLPHLTTIEQISERLQIPIQRVDEALRFLQKNGFIENIKNRWVSTKNRLHLGNNSILIANYHSNWRLQAIKSFDKNFKENLHYSSAVSISKKDLIQIKSELTSCIDSVKNRIKNSKDETLAVFNIDWFEI